MLKEETVKVISEEAETELLVYKKKIKKAHYLKYKLKEICFN